MNSARPTVLVVDDTPDNIDLLKGILSPDYQVRVAIDGVKALELADREPQPDIILLDINMPGMSGYDVCRQLKEQATTSAIPVIFVTALSAAEDEQQGLALGAVDYITKPFDPAIVAARVRTQLMLYDERRQLIRENKQLRERVDRAFRDFSAAVLTALIRAGESDRLEFKSTLRWSLHADKSDKRIENECLKTVAAYLNTDGGVLLVGVADDGRLLGLGNDHFKSEDKFLLHWVNLLKAYLGGDVTPCIRSIVCDLEGQRVLVVECLPSPKPVFFHRDNVEEFFVRMSNTTQSLKPSEVLAYIGQRYSVDR